MRSPRSLQNRLLLSFLVSTTMILACGGFVIYRVIATRLASENDELLRQRMLWYETTVQLRPHNGGATVSQLIAPPEFKRITDTGNPDLVQMRLAEDGKDLYFDSPPLKPNKLAWPPIRGSSIVFTDQTLWDGRPARLCSTVFTPGRERGIPANTPTSAVQVVVGRDLLALQKALSDVRWFLIKIGLAVMGVILIASRLIIRRGVKPVNSLVRQIENIPLSHEGDRFTLPGAPSELQPVVGRLNAMMDRVGAAIEHERQFASNAAHELRNPLAAIRSTIEVALSRTRKPEEYEEALDGLWQSQQGMQRIVDHLLLLARLESGHRQTEFIAEHAVLGKILKKAWLGCMEQAEDKKLRVSWQVEKPETEIMIALSLANIVVTNIMENAVNYTPAGGEIRIQAAVSGAECRLSVENTNPGLREDQLEDTFAPFWRADPNASGHRGNAGIGLALCRRIATTLGGKISASLTPEGMVQYTAQIPVVLRPAAAEKPIPA